MIDKRHSDVVAFQLLASIDDARVIPDKRRKPAKPTFDPDDQSSFRCLQSARHAALVSGVERSGEQSRRGCLASNKVHQVQ